MNIGMILAGGQGTRMGVTDRPKQYLELYGKPVIVHTMETFDTHAMIDAICVVCKPEWREDVRIWIRKFDIRKVRWLADAGESRRESTLSGINAIRADCAGDDIVVIHDAVRPLLSHRIITDNIGGAKEHGAVDTVIPCSDTIVRSTDGDVIESIPVRKELYLGQTPQSFRFSIISDAHKDHMEKGYGEVTDDCTLVMRAGHDVSLVRGELMNMKITSYDDLALIKALVRTEGQAP